VAARHWPDAAEVGPAAHRSCRVKNPVAWHSDWRTLLGGPRLLYRAWRLGTRVLQRAKIPRRADRASRTGAAAVSFAATFLPQPAKDQIAVRYVYYRGGSTVRRTSEIPLRTIPDTS
jgi:hypothetical protein